METCQTILGQTADFEPILCPEPGIRIGEVVRCREHWTKARARVSANTSRKRKTGYKRYNNFTMTEEN